MGVEDDDARAEKGAAQGAPRSAAERGAARENKRLRGGGNVPSHDAEITNQKTTV